MIITATKLNLTIQGAGACDSEVMDQLIDALDDVAQLHFTKADRDTAWTFVDKNGVLAYLVAFGWNISIA